MRTLLSLLLVVLCSTSLFGFQDRVQYRYNCGGIYIDGWRYDSKRNPAQQLSSSSPNVTTGWNFNNTLNQTDAPNQIFGTNRQGASWASDLTYNFEVDQTKPHRVSLYFAESNESQVKEGDRVFSVFINNRRVITDLDIRKEVGKGTMVLSNVINQGEAILSIRFKGETNKAPIVSGIKVAEVVVEGPQEQILLKGKVFDDKNRNGFLDSGENGIVGAELTYAYQVNQEDNIAFETDQDGKFEILVDKNRVGSIPSFAISGFAYDFSSPLNKKSSEPILPDTVSASRTFDFAFYERNKPIVGGIVWNDENENGLQDSNEVGIPGLRVEYRQDARFTLEAFAYTNAKGEYQMEVDNSIARVHLPQQAGIDFDQNTSGNRSSTEYLKADTVTNPFRFNLAIQTKGILGGEVWNDNNRNGKQETSESRQSSVKVSLMGCNGQLLRSTNTLRNGKYYFYGVHEGESYELWLETPPTRELTEPNVDNNSLPEIDSDFYPRTIYSKGIPTFIGKSGCIQISRFLDERWDAGIMPTIDSDFSLGDFVWNDLNKNGKQDSNEPGMANVKVNLIDCTSTRFVTESTNTNSNGNYSFENLDRDKKYILHFEVPSGFVPTIVDVNNNSFPKIDSDVSRQNGRTGCRQLSQEVDNRWDAGFYQNDVTNNLSPLFRINSGGRELNGIEWNRDLENSPSRYLRGTSKTTGWNYDFKNNNTDAPNVLFGTHRYSPTWSDPIRYVFPVDEGTYEVRLYFAEKPFTDVNPGERQFDVVIENIAVVSNLDISAEIGKGTLQKNFQILSENGSIEIKLNRKIGNPIISGIEILGVSTAPPPLESLDQDDYVVYPNPVKTGNLSIFYENQSFAKGKTLLKIFDNQMRLTAMKDLDLQNESRQIDFEIPEIAKGIYFLQVTNGKKVTMRKIIVE